MSWTNPEKSAVAIAKRQLGWERPQYELVLRNLAGIRSECGKISSTNFSATHDGFVRVMAFAESRGFIDQKNGPGYWTLKAQDQTARMRFFIGQLATAGVQAGILYGPEGLAGFIHRQTKQRPLEAGGPTRSLSDLDWEWTYRVLDTLRSWLTREARQRGIKLDLQPAAEAAGSVAPTPSSAVPTEPVASARDIDAEVPF